MIPVHRIAPLALLSALAAAPGLAQPSAAELSAVELELDGEDLDAEEELPAEEVTRYVSVSSKLVQPAHLTAASITVVDRQTIRDAGYRSVGEALVAVPGLFVSYDLMNYHVGLRGLFGGARSGSRTLKIMINGRVAAFTQAGTYLLGPEFIPIDAVERIEIMRGPASGLYGAGALVGAINVVTVRPAYDGETRLGAELAAAGATGGQLGTHLGAVATLTGESTSVLVAASGAFEDRSGMTVPKESPFFASHQEDGRPRASAGDTAIPLSLLARAEQVVGGGRLWGMFVGQWSDRGAEFNDLSVLSRGTRVALYNLNGSAGYEKSFASGFTLRALGGLALGGVLGNDQLDPNPRGEVLIERALSSTELGGNVELLYELDEASFLLAGVETTYGHEQLPVYTAVNRTSGARTPRGDPPPPRDLTNLAAYAQGLFTLSPAVSLSLALRGDQHSVYGAAFAARGGVVLAPTPRLAFKLLGGRSFKGPSPEQLFANPVATGDIQGSTEIRPQYINGGELVVDYFPLRWLHVSGATFFNHQTDNLIYVRSGGFLVPVPFDAESLGVEGAITAAGALVGSTRGSLTAALTHQRTRTEERRSGGLVEKDVPDDETFPVVSAKIRGGLRFEAARIGLFAEYVYTGERVPSQTNLLANQSVDLTRPNYRLGAFHLLNASVSLLPIVVGAGALEAQLRATNLLGQEYSEIGFNGVDVPALGRTLWLTARYAL